MLHHSGDKPISDTYSIGIFLSDQRSIAAILPDIDLTSGNYKNLKRALGQYQVIVEDRHDVTVEIEELLSAALSKRPNGAISSVCIAAPGPILKSGITNVGEHNYGVIRTAYDRRAKFNKTDLSEAFRTARETIVDDRLQEINAVIIHDAAARAIGNTLNKKQDHDKWVEAHIIVNKGVGGAFLRYRSIIQGAIHSELGHIPIQPHQLDIQKGWTKNLPDCEADHSNYRCLETFVSHRAIEERWGKGELKNITKWAGHSDQVTLLGHYLAQLCVSLVLMVSPSRIIFSGAIFANKYILTKIRYDTASMLYVKDSDQTFPAFESQEPFENMIRSQQSDDSAILGCCYEAAQYALRFSKNNIAHLDGVKK